MKSQRIIFFLAFYLFTFFLSSAKISGSAQAATTIGVGAIAQNMHKVSTNEKASRSWLGTSYFPEISLGWLTPGQRPRFYPSIGYTPIAKKSPEGGVKKSFLSLALPLLYPVGGIEFKLGPALQLYRISGSGGTSVQNNGSSTATFYLPSTSVTTRVFYLDLGLAFSGKRFRSDFDIFLTGILSARFAANGIARLSYVF